ncbi:MAG TPA: hypothetical protein VLE22_18045 [Bryobacteraceae bacterium]|nr:hypothetical protein [Bryobacteraceae bacterium]
MNTLWTGFRLSPPFERCLYGMAAGGFLALAFGLLLAPQRALGSLLMAGYGLVCLGLAGILFVAIHYASGAAWGTAFRRVPEAMCAALPYGAAMLAVVFLYGSPLYPWIRDRGEMAGFRAVWLSFPFFLARAILYVGLWFLLTRAILKTSRLQDDTRDPGATPRNARLSVIFLLVFGVTFWLASFDWIMSLEPHWSSTIFGIYNFAGMFSSGLAVIILLVVWMRRAGPLRDFVTDEHLHDLGKLLFAFSTFWMYIWFSQYMLIWYADIPEETVHYIKRQHQFWMPLFIANMVLNWVVPFVVLLPTRTKRTGSLLAKAAAVVLVGRWLDLYIMIQPATGGSNPRFGLWEAAALVGVIAIFILVFSRAMNSAPPVPLGDPHLAESVNYHN